MNAFDGFVILHGSDTMAYTASALSFMLEKILTNPLFLPVPSFPLVEYVQMDGKISLTLLKSQPPVNRKPHWFRKSAICFENNLFRGNRTTKFNSEHFGAFVSGNYPVLADIGIISSPWRFDFKPNFKKLKFIKNWTTISPS